MAEPGTTSLKKGTVPPLLTDHPGRTPPVPVAATEARVEVWPARQAGARPHFSVSTLAVSSSNSRGCGHAVKSPREQRSRTSPRCTANLFRQGFWMEILFHFLDRNWGLEGNDHLQTPPEALPLHSLGIAESKHSKWPQGRAGNKHPGISGKT